MPLLLSSYVASLHFPGGVETRFYCFPALTNYALEVRVFTFIVDFTLFLFYVAFVIESLS